MRNNLKNSELDMLSLKVETVMSIVSIFFCTLKQACYLENIIVQSDFGFSLGPQNLGGLWPRCIIFYFTFTLMLS
jgi:hypothetical protein